MFLCLGRQASSAKAAESGKARRIDAEAGPLFDNNHLQSICVALINLQSGHIVNFYAWKR